MSTREELNALLDELDSDALPDPESLKRALEQLRPGVLAASAVEGYWPSESLLAAIRQLQSSHEWVAKLSTITESVRGQQALAEQLVAVYAQIGSPLSALTHLVEGGVAVRGTGASSLESKQPRKVPRSLGMGKGGPPDLSERSDYLPDDEDGRER